MYKETKTYRHLERVANKLDVNGVTLVNATQMQKDLCDELQTIKHLSIMAEALKKITKFYPMGNAKLYPPESVADFKEMVLKGIENHEAKPMGRPKGSKNQSSFKKDIAALENMVKIQGRQIEAFKAELRDLTNPKPAPLSWMKR